MLLQQIGLLLTLSNPDMLPPSASQSMSDLSHTVHYPEAPCILKIHDFNILPNSCFETSESQYGPVQRIREDTCIFCSEREQSHEDQAEMFLDKSSLTVPG